MQAIFYTKFTPNVSTAIFPSLRTLENIEGNNVSATVFPSLPRALHKTIFDDNSHYNGLLNQIVVENHPV